MKFSTLFAVAASLATTSLASPIESRAVGGVLICTGPNATGDCTHQVYELETCHQLPEPYHKNANTFAPDGEDFSCFPRITDCDQICQSPTGCTFGAVTFDYEHKFNLSAIQWDVNIASFDCILN